MTHEDLQQRLKELEPDIALIRSYWQKSDLSHELATLEEATSKEDFWQHPDRDILLKKRHQIKKDQEAYNQIIHAFTELPELIELFETDVAALKKLSEDVTELTEQVKRFKITALMNEEFDNENCFISINAGAGGTESQDWADMLLRMYLRFCERESLGTQVIDYQPGETAGIKSATVYVTGPHAYGLLRTEQGIHRLVRISPFDASKRRHTSFAAISVTPEVKTAEITIEPKDLRIDTYRAGGAGGQHVNKTESAVRITHIPTNTVAQCQNERSQAQNKETALKLLMAKLLQRQKEEKRARQQKTEKAKKKIEWGSQIRSYVLHPYKMVKDHRTQQEHPQPQLVLDGDLLPFIEKTLLEQTDTSTQS